MRLTRVALLRPIRPLLIAVPLLLVLGGCGDVDDPALTDGARSSEGSDDGLREPGEQQLVGTTWVVTGFLDGSSTNAPSGPGQVRFEPIGVVTGSDGCNGFGYATSGEDERVVDGLAYEIDGDEIHFKGAPVSTLIGCSDDGYESRLRHVLTGTVRFVLEGESLTLVASDGRGVTFDASP